MRCWRSRSRSPSGMTALRYGQPCTHCEDRGKETSHCLLSVKCRNLDPPLPRTLRAAYDGDPAAKSYDEIIFSYPGIYADHCLPHRAHQLYHQETPLIPRIMTEHAHSLTGIDIHPAAHIGDSFVIDHGTGVVVGRNH